MDSRNLSDAQVSYLLHVIEIARWEAGVHDLDVWRSLAGEAERRGLLEAAGEARDYIAEIEAPPKPRSQPEPLASHLPHVHVNFVGPASSLPAGCFSTCDWRDGPIHAPGCPNSS